jgi:hypothetical protein
MEEINSVQDAYLEKQLKTRKIAFSTILALVLALAIVIITLGCVKFDARPAFVTEPDQVTIVTENGKERFDSSMEEYQTFNTLYNEMFNISYLSAIFSGEVGGYRIVENVGSEKQIVNWYTNSNETTFSQDVTSALGSNYVQLHFNEKKKLINSNGSDYVSVNNREYQLSYTDVFFAISEENAVKDFTFLFAINGNNGDRTTITKITLKANTSMLFEEFAK